MDTFKIRGNIKILERKQFLAYVLEVLNETEDDSTRTNNFYDGWVIDVTQDEKDKLFGLYDPMED